MSLLLCAMVTGSTSARLTWDPTQAPSAIFTVYRGTSDVFADAAALPSMPLPVGTQLYNDYTLTPATEYWYWIEDQNSNITGPATIETAEGVQDELALDEAQMNALQTWAYGVHEGLYPAVWRYQPDVQPLKPKILLNALTVKKQGFNDDQRSNNEARAGSRKGVISVAVSSAPRPPGTPTRGLINPNVLAATTYTVTIGGTPYSTTFASIPANNTAVTSALLAVLQAAGFTRLMLYGTDPNNQGLALEASDSRTPISFTVSSNLTSLMIAPPKAMAIAQALVNSLEDPSQRDPLYAAGIGIGQVNDPLDISAMLDTEAELRAQFDFYVFLTAVTAVTPYIIDTASATGTVTN